MIKALEKAHLSVPMKGKVLDLGCMGFHQVAASVKLDRPDVLHYGVDFMPLAESVPQGFVFQQGDLTKSKIPFEDDTFDLVVASHIIEHLSDPLAFFVECVRVCKPGGEIYMEAPSERSLLCPSMPFNHKAYHCLSFFDDPTHIARPWTPQAFFRLSGMYGCTSIETKHYVLWRYRLLMPILLPIALLTRNSRMLEYWVWAAIGWITYARIKKPTTLQGSPNLAYSVGDT